MRKWYAAHGGESCPHGFGLKGYCARCQREGLEEEKSEEARDKRIAELESRLAALEQLIEEGGPGAGYTNA
jgi:hypothetical protein